MVLQFNALRTSETLISPCGVRANPVGATRLLRAQLREPRQQLHSSGVILRHTPAAGPPASCSSLTNELHWREPAYKWMSRANSLKNGGRSRVDESKPIEAWPRTVPRTV